MGGNINGSGSGSPSGKRPRRYIPIGQGFIVEGTAAGVVIAKNVHRVYQRESGADSEFFKGSNTKKIKQKPKPQLMAFLRYQAILNVFD